MNQTSPSVPNNKAVTKLVHLVAVVLIVMHTQVKAQFNERAVADYYLQYTPLAAHVGLGLVGLEAAHEVPYRVAEAAVGMMAEMVVVNTLKYTVREERPDGTARNSFPSGHTATAFLGAELVRMEYGTLWGAGAYAVAAGVAALRVYHLRHYWWDTLGGAACGLVCAHVGQWVVQPLSLRLFARQSRPASSLTLVPLCDPATRTLGTALCIRF